jgi:tetratricopeptide (TPR) repeat protein
MIAWVPVLVAMLASLVPLVADAVILRQDELEYTVTSKGPAAELFTSGVKALGSQDLAAAERFFREAIQADPKAFEPLIGMAEVALVRKQPKEAWDWLQRAERTAPDSAVVQDAIGRYRFAMREFPAAKAALRKAYSLDPDNLLVNLDLGDLLLNALNEPAEAVAAYRRSVRLAPGHAGAHNGLGMALAAQGKYDEAIPVLERAVALAPGNPLSQLSLARVLQAKPDWPKALAAYDAALKAQPGLVPALLGRGDVLTATGDAKGGLAAYEQAVRAAPKSDEVQLKLGMALQGLGRNADAERAYREAVRINPELALAYNNLAWMAAEQRDNLPEAQRWAQQAVELAPKEPLFLDTLGWGQRAQGKPADAVATLRKAAGMDGAGPEIWYHLGVVYEEQSRLPEAEQAYRKALILDKQFAPAQRALKGLGKR